MTRYKYLDYCKGIGILLIVFAHSIQYFPSMQLINGYVISFHVPIFFVASGNLAYLKINQNILVSEFIKKKAKQLLIPYLVFSIFNSVLKLTVLIMTNGLTKSVLTDELIALFITGNGTVWFLMTLFITEIIFVMIKVKINFKPSVYGIWIIIGGISTMIPYVLGETTNPFLGVIYRVLAAIGYYILGLFLGLLLKKIKMFEIERIGIVVFLLGTIVYIVFQNAPVFFDYKFENIITATITSGCLSVAVLFFSYVMERVIESNLFLNKLEFIGRNSLVIMLAHPTILLCFTFPFGSYFLQISDLMGIGVSLLLFLSITILCIPVVWFINKYCPVLIGKDYKKNKEI